MTLLAAVPSALWSGLSYRVRTSWAPLQEAGRLPEVLHVQWPLWSGSHPGRGFGSDLPAFQYRWPSLIGGFIRALLQ